jgi:hypothetical protein
VRHPDELSDALAIAKQSIDQNGELPASSRKFLFQRVQDLSVHEHPDAGYLRRSRLALGCAFEVVGLMNHYNIARTHAEDILHAGIQALLGRHELASLEHENARLHTEVIDLLEHGETAFVSVYAGMACFSAINTILYDTNFDLIGANERDVPPDEWDAAFHASLAVTGGAVWENKGDPETRRQFWLWYLDQAIPYAWDVKAPAGRVPQS